MPRDALPKFVPEPIIYSSAETEQRYPHAVRLIARSYVGFHERGILNDAANALGPFRRNNWNRIETFRSARADAAAEMAEVIEGQRLDRLHRSSAQGSSRGDVTAEWRRIGEEREVILLGVARPARWHMSSLTTDSRDTSAHVRTKRTLRRHGS